MDQETGQTAEYDIFDRMRAGEPFRLTDPQYQPVNEVVRRTRALSVGLNASVSDAEVRERLGAIIGAPVDATTTVFVPFHTNFGKHIRIGRNVFINHDCTLLDMGGITIGDDVLIGPKVSLIAENHPLDPNDRKTLVAQPITIRRNAWIGAAAAILPGVTIGENAVVAAGAVVTKDVPPDTVVGGVPAKPIRKPDTNERKNAP